MFMKPSIRSLIISISLSFAASSALAMSMQELFDSVNAQGNVSNPAVLQGQTMNLYTGGSLFMRMPKRTYNLASVTPPSWSAGCGGIDLFMGGFSFINKEQFVAMMRNIGSNALGYGFKLAIQNLCPTCDNVMQALQATAQQINRLNMDSCEAAKGIINASVPDSWTRGKQQAAKGFGVNSNIFGDIADAWTGVMNNESRANSTINQVAASKPEIKDALPTGNVVWKALKKLNGIDDEYRMVLMSMVGTVIFPTQGSSPTLARSLPARDISVKQLVGKQDGSPHLDFPIWRCDTTTDDGCLNPYEGNIKDKGAIKSFRAMVREKMFAITDKIASRSAHDNVQQAMAFLNVTDLPVYKMIAVTTQLNNTGLADAMINRHQDLIAAKYAEVYINAAVSDINAAFTYFQSTASDPNVSKGIKDALSNMEKLRNDARSVLATAYTQTISTYNIAQEVMHMERVVSSNLSQTLRNSLAFGKSLRK